MKADKGVYRCVSCGLGFTEAEYLRRHLLTNFQCRDQLLYICLKESFPLSMLDNWLMGGEKLCQRN